MNRFTFPVVIATFLFFSTAVFCSDAEPQNDAGIKNKAKSTMAPVDSAKVQEVYKQGRALYFGLDGREVDRIKGFRYLKSAMERGSVEAQGLVAWILYVYGEPYRPVDKKEGYRLAAEIADKNNPYALETQARGLYEGFAVTRDVEASWTIREKAAQELDKVSRGGDALATLILARYYARNYFDHISAPSDSGGASGIRNPARDRAKTIELVEEAAKRGLPDAMCALGELRLEGTDVEPNGQKAEKQAVELFQRAVDLKHPDAYAYLGYCHYCGKGVPRDRRKALELFEEGDRRDSPMSAEMLARCYLANSDGVKERLVCFRSVARDMAYLKKAEKNDSNASSAIRSSVQFLNDLKNLKDPDDSERADAIKSHSLLLDRDKFTELAKTKYGGFPPGGDADSLRAFFALCLTPEVPFSYLTILKDDAFARRYVAFKLYEKASKKHYDSAFFSLCQCYYYGLGVDKDVDKAVKTCLLAAKTGSGIACYYCGVMYEKGAITKVNPKSARNWYLRAVELDCAKGYVGLANLSFKGYDKGVLGTVNVAEGMRLMTVAAEKDDIEAITFLGNRYYNGQYVKKDVDQAAKWYRRGAELNDPACQYYLGEILVSRLGASEKDREEALNCFKASARQGCLPAAQALEYYSRSDPYGEFLKYVPKVEVGLAKDEAVIALMKKLESAINKHIASRPNESKRESLAKNIDKLFDEYRRSPQKHDDLVKAMNVWRDSAQPDFSGVLVGPSEQTRQAYERATNALDNSDPREVAGAFKDLGRMGGGMLEGAAGALENDTDEEFDGIMQSMDGAISFAYRSQKSPEAAEAAIYTIATGLSAINDGMLRQSQRYQALKERDVKLIDAIRKLKDVAAHYGYEAKED